MRIHTDLLSYGDVLDAAEGLPGVYVDATPHGSRTRQGAFEIRLEGNGYPRNTGKYGADRHETCATWDEWGVVLGRLFDKDPDMLCGSAKHPVYDGKDDFDAQTDHRFAWGLLPKDTHKRHTWDFVTVGVFGCKKCSARRISPARRFAVTS